PPGSSRILAIFTVLFPAGLFSETVPEHGVQIVKELISLKIRSEKHQQVLNERAYHSKRSRT
ncbi:MAG TPA: hypothetical protein VL793_03250, partial [Patescibacteria group bacterium]|nr:hypothetical protein [Patescibacteria group bacterium]